MHAALYMSSPWSDDMNPIQNQSEMELINGMTMFEWNIEVGQVEDEDERHCHCACEDSKDRASKERRRDEARYT